MSPKLVFSLLLFLEYYLIKNKAETNKAKLNKLISDCQAKNESFGVGGLALLVKGSLLKYGE